MIIRKIIFNIYFALGITIVSNIHLISKYLGNYILIIFPVLFIILYLLGIFILVDYKYNQFTWNKLFLKKYSLKKELFLKKILNFFNTYHLLATLLLNLRKILKLHRGLR